MKAGVSEHWIPLVLRGGQAAYKNLEEAFKSCPSWSVLLKLTFCSPKPLYILQIRVKLKQRKVASTLTAGKQR